MRLLLAEDEPQLARALAVILERSNFSVDTVARGDDALAYLRSGSYDGAILDVMMPGMDGIAVLRAARAEGLRLPIIMLTAKSEVEDRVAGLDAGANDYLCKPFAPRELVARVRAMLRVAAESGPAPALALGDIELDARSCTLRGPAGEAVLPKREFQVLELLMARHPARISTERLLANVWGQEAPTDAATVFTYISALRRKLAKVGSTLELTALRGAGYTLEARS